MPADTGARALLESLVGQQIQTVTDQPNSVLAIEVLEQPLNPVLNPFDRYRLPGRRATGRHDHAVTTGRVPTAGRGRLAEVIASHGGKAAPDSSADRSASSAASASRRSTCRALVTCSITAARP
jgi:hypothetical protein